MNWTQNTKIVPVVLPGVIVDNDDFVGSKGDAAPVSVDTAGFDYLDAYFVLGATDIAMAELDIWECDTSDGTYTQVPGADYTAALPSATADGGVYAWHVNLTGRKRYFQIEAKAGDGSTGSYGTAFAVLSRAKQGPDTAAERGLAAEKFV